MKKLVKNIITVLVCAFIAGNTIYICKTINRIDNSKEMVIKMMQLGIGSRSEHHVYGEMYGKKYTVTIKADEKTGIIHTKTSWQ